MKDLNHYSRKELLDLPHKQWDASATYNSILLLSTRRKHDSGYAVIAIVGVRKGVPVELATSCSDDIEWRFPAPEQFGTHGDGTPMLMGHINTDCLYRTGAMHMWSDTHDFQIGDSLSCIRVTAVPIQKADP